MRNSYYDFIQKPIITEKSTNSAEQNKYTFKVLSIATKNLVKDAVEKIFNVKVEKVNIQNIQGKCKRFKGRVGYRANYKKAIVTLEKNHVIDFVGGQS